jgi:heme iron utilization protein
MNETTDLGQRAITLQALLAAQQTLLLSTASPTGIPDISYAPFVRDEAGSFTILISELATHTGNLLANPLASVMFVRPESQSNNLFARERAIFDCTAKPIGRSDTGYSTQLMALQKQFGNIVEVLRSLSDFHLFTLTPISGRYVVGFGLAFTINVKDGSLSPLRKSHNQPR